MRATRFTHPAAVDAWDHWFRWRDADRLHDRTIDATWARVAHAVAPAGDAQGHWAKRYVDAFSRWQIVPDERLLARAGTGETMPCLDSPCALLNVAAFVAAPGTCQARFDEERFLETAALAVRLLDDALLMSCGAISGKDPLRIGVLGFADALAHLGLAYDDPRSVVFAARLGAMLDSGTLQGMAELVAERGGGKRPSRQRLRGLRERGSPGGLVDAIRSGGQRHLGLTAIEPHPRLALLANATSDALDPRPAGASERMPLVATTPREGAGATAAARDAIRAAIAPWIDAPLATAVEHAAA